MAKGQAFFQTNDMTYVETAWHFSCLIMQEHITVSIINHYLVTSIHVANLQQLSLTIKSNVVLTEQRCKDLN